MLTADTDWTETLMFHLFLQSETGSNPDINTFLLARFGWFKNLEIDS